MQPRFTALRIIGSIFRILGWLVMIVALIAGVLTIAAGVLDTGDLFGLNLRGGVVAGLLTLFYGLLSALALIGAGEVIYLLIAVEENTRATAMLLNRPGPPVVEGTERRGSADVT